MLNHPSSLTFIHLFPTHFSPPFSHQVLPYSGFLYRANCIRCLESAVRYFSRASCSATPVELHLPHLWHSENTASDTTENDYCSTIKPLLNKHTKGEILEMNNKFADPPFFKIWRGTSLFPPGQEP